MTDDIPIDKLKEEFLKTTLNSSGGKGAVIDKELANDVVMYVVRQVNDFSNIGNVNSEQYAQMLREAIEGLYLLIYITHYSEGEELLDKRPLEVSATNFLKLMFSQVYLGAIYKLKEKEIMAKQPIVVSQK